MSYQGNNTGAESTGREKQDILVLVEHAGQGGAEKVAATLAQALAEDKGYQVHYCALYQPAQFPEIPGVAVSTLGLQAGSGLLGRLQRYRSAVIRLRQFKKKHGIRLTISNLWPADWLNFLTGKERKIAVIHINILNNHQNRMMVKARRLVSFVYKGFDKIVLVGSNLQEELQNFFKVPVSKLQVIHNPVDVKRAATDDKEPLAPLDKLLRGNQVLVAINRLSAIKNTEALLRIYKRLQPISAKLLIVGEGEEKASLKAAAQAAGLSFCNCEEGDTDLSKDIFFAPFQRNVFAILKRAKLFLFPTKGEGIPLVLLEAMSCGCPAIVSDCPNGGVSEIMEGAHPFDMANPRTEAERGTGGYLMPIPTSAAIDEIWAEKIMEMLSLEKEDFGRIRQEAQDRAASFDIAHFAQRWRTLVSTTLKPNE